MSENKLPLESFYETHHKDGKRYGKSVLEGKRAQIYSHWIPDGSQVLDLGGRDGQLTRHFVNGNNVTIADIDKDALALAESSLGVATRQVNLNEILPFEDGCFDVVTMSEVLEHLPYPKITLAEISRVLTEKGLFICNLPLAYHLQDRVRVFFGQKLSIAKDPTHLQFFSFSDLKELLEEFFDVDDYEFLKGGALAGVAPNFFARNVAFRCKKKS